MVQSWRLPPTILATSYDRTSWCELRDINADVSGELQCAPPANPDGHPLGKLPHEIQDLILEKLPRRTRIKYCLVNHAAFHAVQSRTAIIWQGRRGLYRQVFNREHNANRTPVILYLPIVGKEIEGLTTVVWRGGADAPNLTTFKYALIDLLKVSTRIRHLELVRVHEMSQDLIRVCRFKDCPNLRRTTVVRCMQFTISSIGLTSDYPESIIDLNKRTDLHFTLEILPYDARSARSFNRVGRFPYLARLQRYLPYLIRDHPELLAEDADFRREMLDVEGNGRGRVPADTVLNLLHLEWKGPVLWTRDNRRRMDPFIDIIRHLYPNKRIRRGCNLTSLYECGSCNAVLYGACFAETQIASFTHDAAQPVCKACRREEMLNDSSPLRRPAWTGFRTRLNACLAAAIKQKLFWMPLLQRRAKAGDQPHDEGFYPQPHPWVRVVTDESGDDDPAFEYVLDFAALGNNNNNINHNSNNNDNNPEDTRDDERHLRRRYTYVQCPSLRDIVHQLCLEDGDDRSLDPYLALPRGLEGYPAMLADNPFEADERKIIAEEINTDCAYRPVVSDMTEDLERDMKLEMAEQNETQQQSRSRSPVQ